MPTFPWDAFELMNHTPFSKKSSLKLRQATFIFKIKLQTSHQPQEGESFICFPFGSGTSTSRPEIGLVFLISWNKTPITKIVTLQNLCCGQDKYFLKQDCTMYGYPSTGEERGWLEPCYSSLSRDGKIPNASSPCPEQ